MCECSNIRSPCVGLIVLRKRRHERNWFWHWLWSLCSVTWWPGRFRAPCKKQPAGLSRDRVFNLLDSNLFINGRERSALKRAGGVSHCASVIQLIIQSEGCGVGGAKRKSLHGFNSSSLVGQLISLIVTPSIWQRGIACQRRPRLFCMAGMRTKLPTVVCGKNLNERSSQRGLNLQSAGPGTNNTLAAHH